MEKCRAGLIGTLSEAMQMILFMKFAEPNLVLVMFLIILSLDVAIGW